jgi:hypothetical protein
VREVLTTSIRDTIRHSVVMKSGNLRAIASTRDSEDRSCSRHRPVPVAPPGQVAPSTLQAVARRLVAVDGVFDQFAPCGKKYLFHTLSFE